MSRGAGDGPRAHQLRAMLGTIRPTIRAPTGSAAVHHIRQHQGGAVDRDVRVVVVADALARPSTFPGPARGWTPAGANRTAAWNFANRSGAPVFLYMDGQFPPNLATAASPGFRVDGPESRGLLPGARRRGRRSRPGSGDDLHQFSYGGAIVGTAEQLGLSADRVVYASASGTGVLPGGADAWVNHDAAQRYSVTPPGDPIQPVQSSGAHGGDPDSAPGVTRMDSGDYSNGERVHGMGGHGAYFDDPGSDAFKNMVAVIRGDSVTLYVEREPDTPRPW